MSVTDSIGQGLVFLLFRNFVHERAADILQLVVTETARHYAVEIVR